MKLHWNWVVVTLWWLCSEQAKHLFLVLDFEALEAGIAGVLIVGRPEGSRVALVLIPQC